MLIRFIQDYRGVLTNEEFYAFGTEANLPNGSDLVSAGRAEAVVVPKELVVKPPIKGKK